MPETSTAPPVPTELDLLSAATMGLSKWASDAAAKEATASCARKLSEKPMSNAELERQLMMWRPPIKRNKPITLDEFHHPGDELVSSQKIAAAKRLRGPGDRNFLLSPKTTKEKAADLITYKENNAPGPFPVELEEIILEQHAKDEWQLILEANEALERTPASQRQKQALDLKRKITNFLNKRWAFKNKFYKNFTQEYLYRTIQSLNHAWIEHPELNDMQSVLTPKLTLNTVLLYPGMQCHPAHFTEIQLLDSTHSYGTGVVSVHVYTHKDSKKFLDEALPDAGNHLCGTGKSEYKVENYALFVRAANEGGMPVLRHRIKCMNLTLKAITEAKAAQGAMMKWKQDVPNKIAAEMMNDEEHVMQQQGYWDSLDGFNAKEFYESHECYDNDDCYDMEGEYDEGEVNVDYNSPMYDSEGDDA